MAMWTSKLGAKYDKEDIQRLDREHHEILKKLRKEPQNARCAECGEGDTCWASVSIGVFLCVRCSDVHRAVGTHITKVKGCSGTYLWGPDEIARMQEVGNARAEALYGGGCPDARPSPDATKEQRVELCRRKYEQRQWAPKRLPPAAPAPAPAAAAAAAAAAPAPTAVAATRAAAPRTPWTLPAQSQVMKAPVAVSADLIDLDSFFAEVPAKQPPVQQSAWPQPQAHQPLPQQSPWPQSQRPAAASNPFAATAANPFMASAVKTNPFASGDGMDAFLEECLAGPKGPGVQKLTPAPVVGRHSATDDLASVWDNFGAW